MNMRDRKKYRKMTKTKNSFTEERLPFSSNTKGKTDETACLVHFRLRIDHIGTGSSESFLDCCQMLCESFLKIQ